MSDEFAYIGEPAQHLAVVKLAAKIHAICARLREHRTNCKVCVGQTHFAGNSGMLAEPPVIVCGEAKLILLDIFV